MLKITIILLLTVQCALAYLVSNDDDYFVYQTPTVSYILTEKDFKYLPKLIAQTQRSQEIFQAEFAWTLDEKTSLIATSNKNQVANAFATISPNNMIVFYKGGVEFLDPSATSSWIDTLASHEVAHVYQLNAKNQLGVFLKRLFGNQPYIPLPILPWPIFMSPTAFLPTFLLEGNAVLNESRLNQGGRLFSGESLILTTELILSGKSDLKYMLNSNLEFPFGKEKYIVGGFFQSYLADKYGFATLNRFFVNHAENNINPFDLKSSFAATFFDEYENLYESFQQSIKAKQKNYHAYRGPSVATSLTSIEFKRIDDSIYFLTMPDAKTPNLLNRFQIDSKQLTAQRSYLNTGRVYSYEGKLYSAANYSQNRRNVFYSLVDEDYNFVPYFKDKYVTDIEGKNVSYFDMTQSFDQGALYRNQERITETESKALLDTYGNIYYFRQEERLKVLYKNYEKLTSFESNYALLADAINENEIYFVSNTEYGSSLFCFCDHSINRVLPYDNIVSAIKVQSRGYLVSVLNTDRYHVAYMTSPQAQAQTPFNIRSHFSSEYFKPPVAVKNYEVEHAPEHYFSLKQLRFSQYSANFLYSKTYATLINSFDWADPLIYSQLSGAFSLSNKISYNFLSFQYLPYATKFYLSGKNETEFYFEETELFTTNSYQVSFKNTVFEKRHHVVDIGVDFQGDSNKFFENDINTAYLTYQYNESYFLNYLPNTYFSFTPSIESSAGKTSQSYTLQATKKLFLDLYLSLGLSKDDSEYFKLEFSPTRPTQFFKRGINIPVYYSTLFTSNVSQGDLELLYDIPYSKYFYRFPISLRRLAPFLGYHKSHSKEFFYRTDIDDISFATVGLETELLILHTNPTRVRLLSTEITIEDKSEHRLGFEFNTSF